MKYIDALLNRITMYRLVVYALLAYVAWAIVLALVGKISASPTSLIVSLALILAGAYAADKACAWFNKAPANSESWLITGLIIFLIVQPASTISGDLALLLAGVISSLSKTLLTWHGKHLFNPAALAAAVVGLTELQPVVWWVGSSLFWPLTLVLGLAIARKIRRVSLVVVFAAVDVALLFAIAAAHHQLDAQAVRATLIASPLIFLSTVMLTEPATMPPRRTQQLLFAAGVAALSASGWHVGQLYFDPEVALLVGNLYAFAVSPKLRARLKLTEIQKISDLVYNYVFTPSRRFKFLPGQYAEWTLAGVPYDSRGNRRTFTIASSPTESTVQVGLKYHRPSSAYKLAWARLQPGDSVYVSQLAGNFTVDWNKREKLLFIAGGIGITPFRSIVQYMIDTDLQRDAVLIYQAGDAQEFAYREVFARAEKQGLRTHYTTAKLTPEALRDLVPDMPARTVYISGPDALVTSYTHLAKSLGALRVKTDHFAGY